MKNQKLTSIGLFFLILGMVQVSMQEDFWRSEGFLRKLKEMRAVEPVGYNYGYNYNVMTETSKTPEPITTTTPTTTSTTTTSTTTTSTTTTTTTSTTTPTTTTIPTTTTTTSTTTPTTTTTTEAPKPTTKLNYYQLFNLQNFLSFLYPPKPQPVFQLPVGYPVQQPVVSENGDLILETVIYGIPFNCVGRPSGHYRDDTFCDIFHACVHGYQRKTYACPVVGERTFFDEVTQKCEFVSRNPSCCQLKAFYKK